MGCRFNTIEVRLANFGVVVSVAFRPIIYIWQKRYNLRRIEETGRKNIPEVRVQMSMVAGAGEFIGWCEGLHRLR
jgi:hypothetical protein